MEKLKAAVKKAIGGTEPSDTEIAEAVVEAIDTIASIADSLARIAEATDILASTVQGESIRHHEA